MLQYDGRLKERSRELRRSMTVAERSLWDRLRRRQINGCYFSRQRPIGEYIVDFFCHKAKLVIEIDGEYHLSPEVAENDRVKDQHFKDSGFRVLRFTNVEVSKNIDRVVERIRVELKSPSYPSLRKRDD